LTDEVETHALSDVAFEIRHGDYVSIAALRLWQIHAAGDLGLLDSPAAAPIVSAANPSSIWTTPGAPACATARSASFSKAST